jgi:hypothetical protein
MLQLNRPRTSLVDSCDATEVANEVASLARLGAGAADVSVVVESRGRAMAAIAPDALKQIFL